MPVYVIVILYPISMSLYVITHWWAVKCAYPDTKIQVAHMGPTWVLSASDGPHVGPMNLAIRVCTTVDHHKCLLTAIPTIRWDVHIIFTGVVYCSIRYSKSPSTAIFIWEKFKMYNVALAPGQLGNIIATVYIWFCACPIWAIIVQETIIAAICTVVDTEVKHCEGNYLQRDRLFSP